jgi:hypothetical protein
MIGRIINKLLLPFVLLRDLLVELSIKYLDDSCSSISLDVDKCIGVWRTDDLLDFANRH